MVLLYAQLASCGGVLIDILSMIFLRGSFWSDRKGEWNESFAQRVVKCISPVGCSVDFQRESRAFRMIPLSEFFSLHEEEGRNA